MEVYMLEVRGTMGYDGKPFEDIEDDQIVGLYSSKEKAFDAAAQISKGDLTDWEMCNEWVPEHNTTIWRIARTYTEDAEVDDSVPPVIDTSPHVWTCRLHSKGEAKHVVIEGIEEEFFNAKGFIYLWTVQ